ncbi:MAG: hypothetical protein R2695_01680 [Acidimicrobiales bacterium]
MIGLVRAGAGTSVAGATLVDLVNRCPEVTSTVPKQDRARIAWAFDVVTAEWDGWPRGRGPAHRTPRRCPPPSTPATPPDR